MTKSLFRSTTLISFMTSLSRILGFIRDMLIAQFFGATGAIDAFYVAFRIPNFMRALFAEGAFAQAFVPILSEYKLQKTPEETQHFIARVQGALGLALLLVVVFCIIFTPLITTLFAPGFIDKPDQFSLTTDMLRVTFPYLLLISLTAFYASVMNSHGFFGVSAFTPLLLNAAMIVAALWLTPYFAEPVMALSVGVLLAGFLQYFFQVPFLYRQRLFVWPKLVLKDEGVRRVGKLLVPALFGVSAAQLSVVIDTLFASFLPEGSITWLYYSNRLVYFPLGIFGVALATVVLPHLSRKHSDRSHEDFSSTLDWAFRCMLLIAIPASAGLFMLAKPLFFALFQYGEFSYQDALMSSESLMAFALGLPAFMMVKVLASGFYSRQNIKTPVKIAVIALIANVLLNVMLIVPMAHAGLALATSISSTLNGLLLYVGLRKIGAYRSEKGWSVYIMRLMVATGVMCFLLSWLSPALTDWVAWSWKVRAGHLFKLIILGLASFFITLRILGMRLRDFRK